MAMAASPSPALPNLNTLSLNAAAAGSKLRSSRVDCCAFSSGNSGVSRFSCAATRLLVPVPQFPIPAFEVVPDEDVDDEELTFIEYDDDDGKKPNSWLTPQYLSLRLRCSSLMQQEASDALRRHFNNGRKPVASPSRPKIADDTQEAHNSTQPQKHKEPKENHRLQLVSERYVGAQGTVDFITDVVISGTQDAFFDNLTIREPAKACN